MKIREYQIKNHIIKYKGKTLTTKHWVNLTDVHHKKIISDYYQKPLKTDVSLELIKLHNGGVKSSNTIKYFFKKLMSKVVLYHSKWSVADALKSKDICGYFYASIQHNKKMFWDTLDEKTKIQKRISLGGKGVACIPTNFPIKSVREMLSYYNINGNYYDYSCGWGHRLLGALSSNVNYFGTDPNFKLVKKLKKLAKLYKQVNNVNLITDIQPYGSEVFQPQWVNLMGVAFSSPPYFALEDYKIGTQSYTDGVTYEDWLNNYFKQTVINIDKYLIEGGYFLINVKDYDKYNLVSDMFDIIIKRGFIYHCSHSMSNIKRTNAKGGFNDNAEDIMVFKKVTSNENT